MGVRTAKNTYRPPGFRGHRVLREVEGYLKYMATRPRVEKQGSHGLFTGARQSVVLSQVAKELDAHRGNIWTAIYSLRREDAQRLGFDTAARWRALLRSQAGVLAQGLKIPPTHLKWYAAFHNEGHHPHVHSLPIPRNPARDSSRNRAWTSSARRWLRRFSVRTWSASMSGRPPTGTSCGGSAGRRWPALSSRSAGGLRKPAAGIAATGTGWETFQSEGEEGVWLSAARTQGPGEPDRG